MRDLQIFITKMKRQCGDLCVSLLQVYECHRKFKSQVLNLADAACFSQPNTANRPDANVEVEHLIQENQQVTINKMAGEMKINHGMAHRIIHKVAVPENLC